MQENKALTLKCKDSKCQRQGAIIRTLPDGKKVLNFKNNRHDGKIHTQEFSLEEIIKQVYTLDEITAIFA